MPPVLTNLWNSFVAFLPSLLWAIAILVVAWIIARILKSVTVRLLTRLRLDERMHTQGLSNTLGDLVYWLIFLLALPAVLSVLQLNALLIPIQAMINEILLALPNILWAIIILVFGFFAARVVRRVVTDILAAVGVDRIGSRAGVTAGGQGISGLIGLIAYVLVLIPVLTAALQALNMTSLTQPLTEMLNLMLSYVPLIFAAGVLLTVAWILGRIVAGIVAQLLAGLGFDNLFQRLGMTTQGAVGGRPLSLIVGDIVLVAIMLFATIEALAFLRMDELVVIVGQFITLAARVLIGLIIFGFGIWLANLASSAITASGINQARLLAMISRAAILIFAAAMALSQTGLAQEIVNSAFVLLLGGLAVAVALAFGLGGRDAAARVLEDVRTSLEEPVVPPTLPPPTGSTPIVPPSTGD